MTNSTKTATRELAPFGELLVREIAQTTADPRDVQDELRYLLEAWAGSSSTTLKQ